jgi:hypothetical protein
MMNSTSMTEKAAAFDKDGAVKREVGKAIVLLKEFRLKFPFYENLREIEWLDPDRLFKVNPDEVGEFFNLLESYLKHTGYLSPNSSNVYRNARLQITEFKNLLRVAVDDRKSLAQKVDARWERIGGVGQNKQLAIKIIFSFNYQTGKILPIFSIQHLKHFVNRVSDVYCGQTKYLSLGQEYEHCTSELIKAKNLHPLTRSWDAIYFTRFLYFAFPTPDSEPEGNTSGERRIVNLVTDEQLDLQSFMKLLGELQKQRKITGEEFRENRASWIGQPACRGELMQRLKKLLYA